MAEAPPNPETFAGGLFVGAILSMVFYGMGTLQMYYYFTFFFFDDALAVRSLTILTWIGETLHSAFIIHTVYTMFVAGFGNERAVLDIPWSVGGIIFIQLVSSSLVNGFYVYRIWKLSGRIWLPAFIVALLLVRAGSAIAGTAFLEIEPTFHDFVVNYGAKVCLSLGVASEFVSDFLVAITMMVLLQSTTSKQHSQHLVKVRSKLVQYAVGTGFLTMAFQAATLIVYYASGSTITFIGLYFMTGKLYQNSLMASLNLRQQFRGGTRVEVTTGATASATAAPSAGRTNQSSGIRIVNERTVHSDHELDTYSRTTMASKANESETKIAPFAQEDV